jgi:hypothetical protein
MKKYVFLLSALILVGCGKGFKAKEDPYLKKAVEIEDTKQKENETTATDAKRVESGDIARTEKWTQEIPQKYDDVGDFYRIKEIPGLAETEVLDTIQGVNPDSKEVTTTIKLVRGALKLSQVKHQFNSDRTELEVSGDVTFQNNNPIPFVLKGKVNDSEISLEVADPKSNLKNLFKAKAVCLKDPNAATPKDAVVSSDECEKLTIDFYYKFQNTFYTDQLISKAFLLSEIKNPFEEIIVPDEYYTDIPDDQLTDYEKKQKKGKSDRVEEIDDATAANELPSYFTNPSIDDVSVLYPEVKKIVEDNKIKNLKPKKKLKALPELKGDEKIPEADVKIGPPPAMEEPPKPTPQKDKPPVVVPPKVTPNPEPPKTTPTPPVVMPPKETKPPVVTPPKVVVPPVKVEPTKPPMNPPVVIKPVDPVTVSSNRPVDQAWGKPHTGQYIKAEKKMFYLTNSTSLLEVFQKLGPDLGFSIMNPRKVRHYGTYDLVEMVVNLGEWIKTNIPSFDLKVSDISAKNGGLIGHSSHKTGMDVDLAYVTKTPKMAFMDMDRVKGQFTHADFNGAAQWQLFKAAFDMAPVEVIYVNRKIKNEMCRQAILAGDLKGNKDTKSEAASLLTRLVVIDSNHGDHWHLRMDCTTLKTMKLQTKCFSHPQPFVGPECQKVTVK